MADESQIPPTEAPPSPENASSLRDKRIRPEGVVPKQAQGYVVAGLAVLILMAVMFSKNHAKPAATASTPRAYCCVYRHEPAEDSGAGTGAECRPAPGPAAGSGTEGDGQ
ncbi:MAG: hypothetical protein WDN23_04260 [Edaphobacter sp.]